MPAPPSIPASTLDALFAAGEEAWRELRVGGRFHRFIPCDPRGAYEELRRLRARADSFVELGCGVGVVTILADLLGYEACGIELEPELVARAEELAARFRSGATFAEGTFVPPGYQEAVEHLSADFHTLTDGVYAFDELDLELADFDLVFAYPWPDEEAWLVELMRRHGHPSTTLLTYHADGGFQVRAGLR